MWSIWLSQTWSRWRHGNSSYGRLNRLRHGEDWFLWLFERCHWKQGCFCSHVARSVWIYILGERIEHLTQIWADRCRVHQVSSFKWEGCLFWILCVRRALCATSVSADARIARVLLDCSRRSWLARSQGLQLVHRFRIPWHFPKVHSVLNTLRDSSTFAGSIWEHDDHRPQSGFFHLCHVLQILGR